MLSKIREVISEIRNDIRGVTEDDWVPSKYIYSKLISFATTFIKREADDKRLFRYTDIWTTIRCLEMVQDDLVNCCNIFIPNCTKVMRSKEKLPEMYSTRFGYLLTISSVDYSNTYFIINPQQYNLIKSRKYRNLSKKYAWLENGHIIVPDSMVERIAVKGIFPNKKDALKLNCDEENDCISFLDQDFVAPPHLLQDIKTATTQFLLSTYKTLQPDEMQNLNSLEKTNPTK